MRRESTIVVSQFTSSYRYMLGASSRVFGVQSYSESSKKSSSFAAMTIVRRWSARWSVLAKVDSTVMRTIPPRCEVLQRGGMREGVQGM